MPQPAVQPGALYSPLAAGNVVAELGAVVSTSHVYEAGEGSWLPTASVARTSKVWLPSARVEWLFGLVHAAQAPPSRRHSNVEPPSLEEKPKSADVDPVGVGGFESMVVCGASGSIVNVRLEGPSTFPATSTARTRTV